MSIVTLRSSEDFGGTTASSAAAVNFQNFFKDPIYFNKDDQIQVTSVTIQQEVDELVITTQNNRIEYMLLPAMRNTSDTPFFNRHTAFITPGSYTPTALAAEIQNQLNNNRIMLVYEFTVAYDGTANPPTFTITYKQREAPAADNTGQQGLRYDGTGKLGGEATKLGQPTNIAPIPLTIPAPGATNTYLAAFKILNGSADPPFRAQQLALLKRENLNAQLVKPDPLEFGGESLLIGCNYQYIFNKGIYPNAGTQQVTITPSFVLGNVNLMLGANTAVDDFVQIENDGAVGVTNQYLVTAPTGIANGGTLDYDYELNNINSYIGKPLTVGLQTYGPSNADTLAGLNNSANNTITAGGTNYQVDTLYNAFPPGSSTQAVIRVTTVGAGGAMTAFQVVAPGNGFAVGQVLSVNAGNPTFGSGAQITVGVGGIRQANAGTQNGAGTAITVGNSYKVFFPATAMSKPDPTSPSFPNPVFSQLTADMNGIDLRAKVLSINATTNRVQAVEFTSIGLNRATTDFTRLLDILTFKDTQLGLLDNNGSFTAISTSIVQITSKLTSIPATDRLLFCSRPDGLCGLGSFTSTSNPAMENDPIENGAFDVEVMSVIQDVAISSTEDRGLIPKTGEVYAIDRNTGAVITNGRRINKFVPGIGKIIPTFEIVDARTSAKFGFLRNEAREEHEVLGGANLLPEADILFELDVSFQKTRDDSKASGVSFAWQTYQLNSSTFEYPTTRDRMGAGQGTRVIQSTTNLKSPANFDPTANDQLLFGLDKLNRLTVTFSQPAVAAYTPFTYRIGDGGGGDPPHNPLRETCFPLCPTFELSMGVPAIIANPVVGQPDIIKAGVDYTITGKYNETEVPVQGTIRGAGSGSSLTNVYQNITHPPGTGIGLGEATTQEAFVSQSGAGSNPNCLQLPITYTFGEIQPDQIDFTNPNPQPVGNIGIDKVGFTQFEPNLARIQPLLGTRSVENKADGNLVNQQSVNTVSSQSPETGLPPSMIVEFPDFNIQGYSGAAQDKFKTVATIPTEEWGTSTTNGTLHYKPLFALPIDVNLAEDKELYSMNVRLRNLDGTLAKNLKNPTTVTFYKKPREGKELERVMNRALQSRSENQDQKIASRTDAFPRV